MAAFCPSINVLNVKDTDIGVNPTPDTEYSTCMNDENTSC